MNIFASILSFTISAQAQSPLPYGIEVPNYSFQTSLFDEESGELEDGDGYAKRKKGNSPLIDDKKQVIKTLQKKTFLKMKRWEASLR